VKSYLLIRLGEPTANLGTGYFVMKDLLIADGSMYDVYDATVTQCVTNCQTLLLATGGASRCITCNTNYHEQAGQCILSTSCTTKDPNIPKCRTTPLQCSDTLMQAPSCTACIAGYILVDSTCIKCPYNCASCTTALVCSTCGQTREAQTAPTCDCSVSYYSDKIFP